MSEFERLIRDLSEYIVKNGNLCKFHHRNENGTKVYFPVGKISKKFEFFSHDNPRGLVSSSPNYLPFHKLEQMKNNGYGLGIDLEKGMVEINYGNSKSKKMFKHFLGTAELGKDDKLVLMGNVSTENSINPIGPERLSRVKEHLKVLNDMGLIKNPEYLSQLNFA